MSANYGPNTTAVQTFIDRVTAEAANPEHQAEFDTYKTWHYGYERIDGVSPHDHYAAATEAANSAIHVTGDSRQDAWDSAIAELTARVPNYWYGSGVYAPRVIAALIVADRIDQEWLDALVAPLAALTADLNR